MIQLLSTKYKKHISWPLFVIFYLQIGSPLSAAANEYSKSNMLVWDHISNNTPVVKADHTHFEKSDFAFKNNKNKKETPQATLKVDHSNIGGPTSPEAASFKAVGSNNLVNLATGDFSYSIPLLDVDGYPVNLFYNGGIGMEQEASWVGLGWNINPGTVTRNMRGIPDDFNGTDTLTQTQNVKPNRTWGGDMAIDAEYVGIKFLKLGASLGFSYNNYLGPSMEIGNRISLSVSTIMNVVGEKSAPATLGLTASLGTKLNSRSGLTFSPSLNASLGRMDSRVGIGVGLSTSYNSRIGIKDLTISSGISIDKAKSNDPLTNQIDNKVSDFVSDRLQGSATISFAKPTYITTLRMPMQNTNFSGQLELGFGFYGFRGSASVLGYYSESKVPLESRIMKKPMVGYMYSENANENQNAVMDFNRLNDAEVTPHTPIISAPQYNYDVFSIQGEGTGGSIRAYRGDLGFVRDNVTNSKEANVSIGFDLGIPFHYGFNWNAISTPTKVGGWEDGNNMLLNTMKFTPTQAGSSFENIYFKNPGEASVTTDDAISRIGRDNLVRFKLSGSNQLPRLESALEQFDKHTGTVKASPLFVKNDNLPNREKRTQVTTMLTADEASKVGLEKEIRNYRTGTSEFDSSNDIVFDKISRTHNYRQGHHISEIDVLEQNGMRYIYGIPVYSVKQKDFTFSVGEYPDDNNQVLFGNDEPTIDSRHMENKSKIDGYVQSQEVPAYASSFLITGLLSPDYVDVTGNGITEDDLGGAVKFNYTQTTDSNHLHKWRTPRNNTDAASANFSDGVRTEKKDNKATISYGEREAWYLNSIESKSMIAIFVIGDRNDAKGVKGEMDGKIDTAEKINKRLNRIDLYTKSELKTKGIANARPVKSVNFEYNYSLCNGTPDNKINAGKLTLKSIYFSYNGQSRSVKDRYVFNYGDTASQSDNPSYALNASDRWGTYKPKTDPVTSIENNPAGLSNIDYPFSIANKSKADKYASAWNLKKILLPSGGQMEIQYESDNYAYVQDRRACNMFEIYGLGKTKNFSNNNSMYNSSIFSADNRFVYIKLPQPLLSTTPTKQKEEIYSKYLQGLHDSTGKKQLAFKLLINMPNGLEPLTIYGEYDDYGLCSNSDSNKYIYIHLKEVDGKSPLAKSAIGFLTENIPGQAFPGYDIDVDGIAAFVDMAGGMLNGLKSAFENVDQQMRSAGKAKRIILGKSFIRLANPDKIKYGGGLRVKRILVRDNWHKMSDQYNSVYGQDYDYTTTETINNKDVTVSSGVASYEPAIGSEENPFREILSFSNKLPLASAEYGAIEMPMLEAFYPSPSVVYSKVTIRSIHRKGTHGDSTLRSAIGKQVTEFYTARDYPSYSTYTSMNVMDFNKNPFFSFFYKEVINRRTISQGFLVETNDMHGKIKSQVAYSESDEKTPLSASYHSYKNTGKNGLNDKVNFVYNNESGTIHPGNIGIDMELMTDSREFSVKSNGFNGQLQVDIYMITAIPIPIPTFYPLKSYVENKYRAVTCTKLINYHAIEDSIIVMDKGSTISTKTLAYDAETGTPIVTKTVNEFNDTIYNVSYPAYWAYSDVGLAYKNIGRQFKNVNFSSGKIQGFSINQDSVFESGDELYISQGAGSPSCIPQSADVSKIWAYDKNKNSTALTIPTKDIVFMDSAGILFTKAGVNFKIIRSGKRNNLGLTVASATCMTNPIKNVSGTYKLVVDNNTKVVSTSAIDYKEKWQSDNEVFERKLYYADSCSDDESDSLSCNGILTKNINPYLKGLVGNLRPYRSYTFYGQRNESNTSTATTIRKNGYINNYGNFWSFNSSNNLIPDYSNAKWVWNSELTKVNAKGQELETKDALNRYTAGQYGFNRSLAIGMTQNARYGESFNEGFEDNEYIERINKQTNVLCTDKYIDFTGLAHSSIVNLQDSNFQAHTGKYALKINADTIVEKPFKINNYIDSFNLKLPGGIITNAALGTGTVVSTTVTPSGNTGFSTTFSNLSMLTSQIWPSDPDNANLHFNESAVQYTRVFNSDYYTFTLISGIGATDTVGSDMHSGVQVKITNLETGAFNVMSVSTCYSCDGTRSATQVYTLFLHCGIYKLESYGYGNFDNTDGHALTSHFSYECIGLDSYVADPCNYTKPIPANDSLLNPSFILTPGNNKKMFFSAWVKQACDVPCLDTDLIHSNIYLLKTNGIDTFKRTGKIIEGWQKVEGDFKLDATDTTAVLQFVNSNNSPMYVDDIRIHPYNANMKSYVYDPRTLRLSAELDENNYASFYEYDEEGQLIRIKKETIQGIKTIKESRNAKQKSITDIQQ